ncbi:MAG: hypothetical protein NZP34_14800, partial [Caldilineales bacterium]|nr:hypothetical protein [Caldilineales bacterium]
LTPYAEISDPDGLLDGWLRAHAQAVVEHRLQETTLRFYARTPARAAAVRDPVRDVRPQVPLALPIAEGLMVTGYDLALTTARPGDRLHLFLYGQADRPGAVTLALRQGGADLFQRVLAIPAGWSRSQVDILIPPMATPGRASIELVGSAGRHVLTGLTLRGRREPRTTPTAATPTHPLDVPFGEGIRLVGYDLDRVQLRPGESLALTLYWQAQGTVSGRYKVFTHLLGEQYNAESGNFLWGQQDNEPVGGERPTTTWRPGEVIADPYRIGLHPQAPPGVYRLEIGLYHPTTGERLPRLDEGGRAVADHLILTTVTVIP